MVRSKRIIYIAAISVTVIALVILAMSISGVELEPGTVFYTESEGDQAEFYTPSANPLRGDGDIDYLPLIRLLIILPTIAIILITIFIPSTRKYTLRNLIIVLAWSALVYYMYTSQTETEISQTVEINTYPANLPIIPQAPMPEVMQDSPNWVTYLIGFIIIMILLALAYFLYQRSTRREEEQELLSTKARVALEEIQSGADFRNVILRCYYEMSQIILRDRGLDRKRWMTAREFEIRLVRAGLPAGPVKHLTRLFELVRYGAYDPSHEQELLAIDSLTAIAQAGGKSG